MKKIFVKFLFVLSYLIFPFTVTAQTAGFGEIADRITEGPVSVITQFMYAACYVAGTFFLFKAYEAFKGHRIRPETIGIVNVYFLTAFGLGLLLLPLIHHLVDKVY